MLAVGRGSRQSGILAAYWIYVRNWGTGRALDQERAVAVRHRLQQATMWTRPTPKSSSSHCGCWPTLLADAVEMRGIDGAVERPGPAVGLAGEGLRRLQTGLVRNYALAMLVGVVAVLAYFVVRALLGW